MDPRQQRGIFIAATCRLHRNDDGTWLVPSQTNRTAVGYVVNLGAKTCTCPDHAEGGFVCKHCHAAVIDHQRDVLPDGTVIETRSVTLTEKKVYKQDWPAYNLARATEKRRVRVLLHDLCRNLPERERPASRSGPKPHLVRDCVFAMAYKVYCGQSSRRFSTDLLEAHERGFVSKPIPGPKVTAFFEGAYFTPILKELIAYSARPLRAVERDFAIDSTGFASTQYERWYDQKYGVTRLKCLWVKAHIASGVKTNEGDGVHQGCLPRMPHALQHPSPGIAGQADALPKPGLPTGVRDPRRQCAFSRRRGQRRLGAGSRRAERWHHACLMLQPLLCNVFERIATYS